jgi:hypothetical protein
VITSAAALGDGQSSNTRAIQNLIDKTAREGGGTIVVPAGTFITGALFFNQDLDQERQGRRRAARKPARRRHRHREQPVSLRARRRRDGQRNLRRNPQRGSEKLRVRRGQLTVNSVGMMHGLADSPIENVKFENCKITAQKGFAMENARKVDLSGLTVDVKEGEPITRRNVQ